mmetsp:Transcript_16094/g.23545  ORF Transcript_16094/g.23545 Transcript_16094/m.23545 type:complete len:419 (-) Transcript_16094:320-1576(-)
MKLLSALFLLKATGASAFSITSFAPAGINQCTTIKTTSTSSTCLFAKKKAGKKKTASKSGGGFGASSTTTATKKSSKKSGKSKGNLLSTLNDESSTSKQSKKSKGGTTYVKSEQDALLAQLAASASQSPIGAAVASSPLHGTPEADPFWELIPSLIQSKFPNLRNEQLGRVAGFAKHTLDENLPLEDSIVNDKWRPHEDMHAYMPGLGETKAFHDPSQLELCKKLSENIDTIEQEYEALLEDMEGNGKKDRFQSVTSMNYDAGWKTLVLFYNGHRIKDFPYHLCPVTTKIMESVPLAGRIAGFNRQQSQSGIPLHSDGNNMWLTTQMGIKVPEGEKAYIRVGPETRRWKKGECLLYDTTYEHETFNESEDEERVVLHVDFFNTIAMTKVEIDIMRYIYKIREDFMRAEGVAKVGAQIL